MENLKQLTQEIFKKKLLYRDIEEIKHFDFNLSKIQKIKKRFHSKNIFTCRINKRYGTLSFSGIARSAFISQRILIDLKEKNLVENELENFYNSLPSITKEMNRKFYNLKDKNNLIKDYGHLRPSTYDITSLNYQEGFNSYFNYKSKKV